MGRWSNLMVVMRYGILLNINQNYQFVTNNIIELDLFGAKTNLKVLKLQTMVSIRITLNVLI